MPDATESRSTLLAKQVLAGRLRQVRSERFGEDGVGHLAAHLDIPLQTWLNYEAGVGVPGEILLAFLVLADVEPRWLLRGEGARFRPPSPAGDA